MKNSMKMGRRWREKRERRERENKEKIGFKWFNWFPDVTAVLSAYLDKINTTNG